MTSLLPQNLLSGPKRHSARTPGAPTLSSPTRAAPIAAAPACAQVPVADTENPTSHAERAAARPSARKRTKLPDSSKIACAADGLVDALNAATEMLKRNARNARNARSSKASTPCKQSSTGRRKSHDVGIYDPPQVQHSVPDAEIASKMKTPRLQDDSLRDLRSIAHTLNSITRVDDAPVGKLLASVWGKRFVIGTHKSMSSSLVKCYDDRLEYMIRDHPEESSIKMMMYFKDLQSLSLNHDSRTLTFTVLEDLDHFSKHYRGGDQLLIVFAKDNFATFETTVWPIMQLKNGNTK